MTMTRQSRRQIVFTMKKIKKRVSKQIDKASDQLIKLPQVPSFAYIFLLPNQLTQTPKIPSSMPQPQSPFQITQIHEFRSILQQISQDNERSIRECLLPLLEDADHLVRKTTGLCLEELDKKEHQLANVVQFSLHILNELQGKNQTATRTAERLAALTEDFDKLLVRNEELTKKLEEMEDENYQFKNKILQAQTYISEASLPSILKAESQSDIDIHSIQISTFSKKCSHLTERPSIKHQKTISIEEFNSKIQLYEHKMQNKSLWIAELEKEIKGLKQKIMGLESELTTKHSELELSELYFKEKLDILAHNQTLNKSQQVSISEIQINSIFKRDLLRVNSSKSILSIAESSHSSDSGQSYHSKNFLPEQTPQKRTNHVRRSLMYDFATDFDTQAHRGSLYSSIIDRQSMSPDSSCILRERKKSISVSTADMKKTSTKGVQTSFDPVTRIIKRNSNQYDYKSKEKKDAHDSSFLGLGSITSMFSKKTIPKQKSITEQVEQQSQGKTEYSILGESSIGDIFKGILDYATKKIVTDRVHKKSKNNLNQSFMQELNKAVPKKKIYVK